MSDHNEGKVAISGIRSFNGELRVPGDKSISHRALLISALSSGVSQILGLSSGKDVQATRAVISRLGAKVNVEGDHITVEGGRRLLKPPDEILDVGNSGTLIRLAAGMVAGLGGRYSFTGDESVNRRPMARIFKPLTEMGAKIEASGSGDTAPFTITSHGLNGIRYEMPIASAQVKSAILFAGLGARGTTTVVEHVPTRRHTEEMLGDAGALIEVEKLEDRSEIRIERGDLHPVDYDIPGDPSQAAFWLVAALITPNSQVTVRNIYLGDLRSDFISVLERMGGDLEIIRKSQNSGDVTARSSNLNATEISPKEIPGIIDEIPILSVAAVCASGTTTISGAAELRVKESDRISVMTEALRSFGAKVDEFPDGMAITRGGQLHSGKVSAHLDHRIAMASSILGAAVEGETEVLGFDSVASSYPNFVSDLLSLMSSNDASSRP
ncbi:MAG: 3-phosphoshikimate 1-carboxyvinyltransferase [Actinomycetota bacterium]|jgi:3-phosphoshikimate 1-carboxyvinyltransferase|nr:3-phosphoshikimate 1-carboxyvinyltransferase [Actinomycetota bacterium]